MHLKTFNSEALKMLKLSDCDILPGQLIKLFRNLSYTKLERFNLKLNERIAFDGEPTQTYLLELKNSFASFARN